MQNTITVSGSIDTYKPEEEVIEHLKTGDHYYVDYPYGYDDMATVHVVLAKDVEESGINSAGQIWTYKEVL